MMVVSLKRQWTFPGLRAKLLSSHLGFFEVRMRFSTSAYSWHLQSVNVFVPISGLKIVHSFTQLYFPLMQLKVHGRTFDSTVIIVARKYIVESVKSRCCRRATVGEADFAESLQQHLCKAKDTILQLNAQEAPTALTGKNWAPMVHYGTSMQLNNRIKQFLIVTPNCACQPISFESVGNDLCPF